MPAVIGNGLYGTIPFETVIAMVGTYRKKDPTGKKALKHAHYSALEILTLFHANGVLNDKIFDLITQSVEDIKQYGVKIYLGTHTSKEDCPPQAPHYIGYDAPILCNTILVDIDPNNDPPSRTRKKWKDLIQDGDSITILKYDALDQGSLCPPNCDDDNDGNGMSDILINATV